MMRLLKIPDLELLSSILYIKALPINPLGSYSDRKLALTLAYRVLVHAEIEAYFEDRVWEVALNAKKNWDNQGKTCRTLICLLAFSGLEMEVPPHTLTPSQGSKKVPDGKIKINKKIDSAMESFKRAIKQNHGIKEANLLALLLPIGIDTDDLDDPTWLATMNTFGEERGVVAHSSSTSPTIQVPDPATELRRIEQIISPGLCKVDELINKLRT